jgi:hypothetical protein
MTDIRMVGHSNGGDRLYLGILNGAGQNEVFKGVDIKVQFYGTPSNTYNIQNSAERAGLKNHQDIKHIINSGDFVGNILGSNSRSINEQLLSVAKAPLLLAPSISPHSSYYCVGSFCDF